MKNLLIALGLGGAISCTVAYAAFLAPAYPDRYIAFLDKRSGQSEVEMVASYRTCSSAVKSLVGGKEDWTYGVMSEEFASATDGIAEITCGVLFKHEPR